MHKPKSRTSFNKENNFYKNIAQTQSFVSSLERQTLQHETTKENKNKTPYFSLYLSSKESLFIRPFKSFISQSHFPLQTPTLCATAECQLPRSSVKHHPQTTTPYYFSVAPAPVTLKGQDKDQIEVNGERNDTIKLTTKIQKKAGHVDIASVAEEKK